MRVPHRAFAVLVLAVGLTACDRLGDSSAPAAPSPLPSTDSQALPQAIPLPEARPPSTTVVSSISGFVLDTGFRPLAGARIEVLDGPQTGTIATADATGQFSVSGIFDATTRFRATQDGHTAATQVWNCSVPACAHGASPWLGFYLDVTAPPVNLAGEYTVTFVADHACSDLPAEVRTRTYAATIAPGPSPGSNGSSNTSMTVTLSGASFLGHLGGFEIGVAGDHADFWLHGGHDPAVVEQLAQHTYVALSGNATATVAPGASTISTSFDGWIEYCVSQSPLGRYNCGTSPVTGDPIPGAVVTRAHCESKNHQLILARR